MYVKCGFIHVLVFFSNRGQLGCERGNGVLLRIVFFAQCVCVCFWLNFQAFVELLESLVNLICASSPESLLSIEMRMSLTSEQVVYLLLCGVGAIWSWSQSVFVLLMV